MLYNLNHLYLSHIYDFSVLNENLFYYEIWTA